MTLHYFLMHFLGTYGRYAWVLQGFIIFLTIFLAHVIQKKGLAYIQGRLERTRQVWDDTLIKAFSRPFTVALWFISATYIVRYTFIDCNIKDYGWVSQVRIGGIVVLSVWFLWRYIVEVEYRLVAPKHRGAKPVDRTTAAVVSRLAKIALFALTVLWILHFIGAPLTGLLAFGGGSAIAMGIAAQDLLANFFGGLMLYLDRPFKIGDWIEAREHHVQGTVERIGWRTTKVLTFEKRPLYVPNSLFSKTVISNPQRMSHRHLNVDIGIRYDDVNKMTAILDDIRIMLHAHPAVDQNERVLAHFVTIGESSLGINVYCFSKALDLPSWRSVQQDIYLKLLAIIAQHGAEVAFPTRTLDIKPQGEADDRFRKVVQDTA